jgi:hypothetical protein
MNPTYVATARLLTEIAPVAFDSGLFALKGARQSTCSFGTCRASLSISIWCSSIIDFLAHKPWRQSTRRYEPCEIGWCSAHSRSEPCQLLTWARPSCSSSEKSSPSRSFSGMTTEPVKLETLLETRERLFRELPAALDANERELLRTLVRGRPDWSLLDIPHLEELPAIRWRLQNLDQLSRSQPARFRALATALDERLASVANDRAPF